MFLITCLPLAGARSQSDGRPQLFESLSRGLLVSLNFKNELIEIDVIKPNTNGAGSHRVAEVHDGVAVRDRVLHPEHLDAFAVMGLAPPVFENRVGGPRFRWHPVRAVVR